ncbi:condensation domain-containing protein [Actinoalloteichus caeruleus]|uniref:Condensation domain-containing protein n=1 Tax=Actinoalloteichus caeruleus DSM 43889 TaxID=1120930 RepID=A0ABT1JEV9_ACTCY|nr:condensation domain-containing protein [Actinoalloteichus caeruleus]MCP2330311.1 Condensation domain-containing protein [Actinoalloteichus caeruleus DSM 43889]
MEGLEPVHLARSRWWAVPTALTDELVETTVRFVLSRHEALRTRLVGDTERGVRQVVDPVDEDVVRARPDLVLGESAPQGFQSGLDQLAHQPFDLHEEWPVRWFLGRRSSGDHVLVAVVHHFVAGFQGCAVLDHEIPVVLDNLASGRAPSAGLPEARGPRQWWAEEDSPRGRRLDARAREHVRRILRDLPSTPFPVAANLRGASDPRAARRVGVTLTSPAVDGCLSWLSQEWGVPHSAVLLAAVSRALAHDLVDESALAWQVFGDRAGPLTGSSSVCYEPVTTLLPASGLAPDGDLLAASSELYRRLLVSLRARAFGDRMIDEEAHHVSRTRGVRVETPFWFNFVDSRGRRAVAPQDLTDPADELRRGTGFDEYEGDRTPGDDFLLYVWREPGQLRIGVYAHERYADVAALRAVLARCAALLHRAAVPSATAASGGPDRRRTASPRWTRLDGGRWTAPDVVRAVLASLVGVESVDVRLVAGDRGTRLHAHLTTSTAHSVDAVRTAALAMLDVPGFAVPDEITLSRGRAAPREDGPERAPALRDLVEIVGRLCGLPAVDPRLSYLAAGGAARHLPSILRGLGARGWDGLSWQDLCSHRSLESLAIALRRK